LFPHVNTEKVSSPESQSPGVVAEQANESIVAVRPKSGDPGIAGAVSGSGRGNGPASILGAIEPTLFHTGRLFQ
jgi:hypothetical protein